MPSDWKVKVLIVAMLVIGAVYYLVPTFAGWPADLKDAKPGEVPAWAEYFPDARLKLGLDLQGGLDLTLEVDVDSAITNKVQRDLKQIEDALNKEAIGFEAVTRPEGTAEIALALKDESDLPRARKAIDTNVGVYQYDRTETVDGREQAVFVLQDEWRTELSRNSVDQVMETLRNRIDQFGVSEMSIAARGENRINVQLPGLDDPDRAIKLIGKTALLEFKMVNRQWGDTTQLQGLISQTVASAGLGEDYSDEQLNAALVGQIPSDCEVLWEKQFDPLQNKMVRTIPYLVKKEVSLTGDYIEDARVANNQYNMPYVQMSLNRQGAKLFEDLTGANVGELMAIVLDGTISSAPVIRQKIGGGVASIEMGTGNVTALYEEARDLAVVLRAGALPAPIRILENRAVGASLGQDSIEAGVFSFVLGASAVVLFMLVYYRVSGLIADLMLVLNVLFILAAQSILGATLTLPGIAGIVLTIGMAVDANVIIYERIREELRLGRSPSAAVTEGYAKALTAIMDANITTLIAGIVLYSYGSGPVKGFAVTLSIGIITSVFTAVVVSKMVFDWLIAGGAKKRLSI